MTDCNSTATRVTTQEHTKSKCRQCNIIKAASCFHRDLRTISGLRSLCKDCYSENIKAYRKTKDGLISKLYSCQRDSSKKRGHEAPTYSKQDFFNWCFHNPKFSTLYSKWVDSGYSKWEKPSVDRIDDYKGYSFDNIQLLTWRQNFQKASNDKVDGLNNKNSKAVNQYDLNGGLLKTYHSAHQASRETGVSQQSISKVCLGKSARSGYKDDGSPLYSKRKTAGGYIWRFAEHQSES